MCNGCSKFVAIEQTTRMFKVCYVKRNIHVECLLFILYNGTDTVNNTCLLCEMEQTQWIAHVCYVKWNRHSE